MSRFLLFTLSFLSVLNVISYCDSSQNQAGYPAWFWYPPLNNGSDYAVGFLQPCLKSDSALSYAKSETIWNILSQKKIRVTSKSGNIGTGSSVIYMGKNVQFEVDSLGYDGIYDDYIILDKSYMNYEYMLITLVGPKDDSTSFRDNIEVRDYGDWTHERPVDDEYYYAAGMAPEYYYQSSSWKRAVTRALEEMALLFSSKVEAMNKDETIALNDDNIYNYYKISRFEEDCILKNWQVAARKIEKIDPYTTTYNVLIRMPKHQ